MHYFYQNKVIKSLSIWQRNITKTTGAVLKPDLIAPAYKPELVENQKYEKWERENLFSGSTKCNKETFSMVLPPPNVTGKLHLGHALASTIQDVIVRRKRSMGHNVLWLPGIDHAGIATQGVVEKHLKSTKNVTRHDLGREKFNKEVWKWKEKHSNTITQQLRTLGCSLDWSREVFTMDQRHTDAVNTAFIQLFRKSLIYRKKALVNWCNALKSTVSDIEVESMALSGPTDVVVPGYEKPVKFGYLYNFAYKLLDSNEEIIVSTTMPETMLGDVAIAVHPSDPRFGHLKGRMVAHPFKKRTLPIIFDDFVDMNFGSGAVKITPAHSKIDYEVAKRHKLPLIQVINEEGKMINASEFTDMKRYDCRQRIVQQLDNIKLMRGIVPHQMTLPICTRTNDIIEHLPKEQWFVSCKKLNEKAADVVKAGVLKIMPEKFNKIWLNWCEDNRDWCISRQLWWGHQIPAYKCTSDKDLVWIAAKDDIEAKTLASKYLRTLPDYIETEKDTDVLDTWFSSGIYPFASLGWPECHFNPEFRKFYPLSLMATGHDILGFWVHRMVILGLELTGTLPFEKVLLHGIICDNKGAKMSKSKGNVIDPVDVINGITMDNLKTKTHEMFKNGILNKNELNKALSYHKANFSNKGIPQCGVDALRFTLLSQDIKSHFVNFDVNMCHSNKLFCNKIWQSVKYTNLSFSKLKFTDEIISKDDLTYFDRWILSRLAVMVEKVNNNMENYDFHLATKALRTFIYNEFCDIYLEATKPGFETGSTKVGYTHAHTLSTVLNTSLRCLAPFMIYVTEELIPKVPEFQTNIIHNFTDSTRKYYEFPQSKDFDVWKDEKLEEQVSKVLNTIFVIRELKGFYSMSNKLKPAIFIKTTDEGLISNIKEQQQIVLNLSKAKVIQFGQNTNKNFVRGIVDKDTKVFVEIVGADSENAVLEAREKLIKKVKKMEDHLTKLEEKLSTQHYLTTVSEHNKILDRENLLSKKEELKQMRQLTDI